MRSYAENIRSANEPACCQLFKYMYDHARLRMIASVFLEASQGWFGIDLLMLLLQAG